MSGRRKSDYKDINLWLFRLTTTDTTNELENNHTSIGAHFQASELDEKVYTQADVMFGRVGQSGAVQRYITTDALFQDYKELIGSSISEVEFPNEHDLSTIQMVKRKTIKTRGNKHNKNRKYEYVIEVS